MNTVNFPIIAHHFYDHTENHLICPECGEILYQNLPQDDEIYNHFISTYRYQEDIIKKENFPKWFLRLIIGIIIFIHLVILANETFRIGFLSFLRLPTANPSLFYKEGSSRFGSIVGPFSELVWSVYSLIALSAKGFDFILNVLKPELKTELAKDVEGINRFWLYRLFLYSVTVLSALLFLPHYPNLFGRFQEVTSLTENDFKIYSLVCYFLYLMQLFFILITEYRTYTRHRLIASLNQMFN